MTVVHNRFTWREKAALALKRQRNEIPRECLMAIRRAARAGLTQKEVIETLGLEISPSLFSKRMQEFQIKFSKSQRRGHI